MGQTSQNQALLGELTVHYPTLSQLEVNAADLLVEKAVGFVMPKGTEVFAPGQSCKGYLLLGQGVVRVQSVSREGREARPLSRKTRRDMHPDQPQFAWR